VGFTHVGLIVVRLVTIVVHTNDGLTGWEVCSSRGSEAIMVILCCLLLIGGPGRDFAVGGMWGRIGLCVFLWLSRTSRVKQSGKLVVIACCSWLSVI